MKQGAAIMPEALRWLWRGYPNPIVVREPAAMRQPGWDPRGKVYSIVSAAQTLGAGGRNLPLRGEPRGRQRRQRILRRSGRQSHLQSGRRWQGHRVPGAYERRPRAPRRAGRPPVRVAAGAQAHRVLRPRRRRKSGRAKRGATDLAITAKGAIYFADAAHKTIGYIGPAGKPRIVYNGGEIALPSASRSRPTRPCWSSPMRSPDSAGLSDRGRWLAESTASRSIAWKCPRPDG